MNNETIEKARNMISKEFIQDVLRRSEKDSSIVVNDVTVAPATAKGDNYTSDMFRIVVDFTHVDGSKKISQKMPLIVKFEPIEEGQQKKLVSA